MQNRRWCSHCSPAVSGAYVLRAFAPGLFVAPLPAEPLVLFQGTAFPRSSSGIFYFCVLTAPEVPLGNGSK